MARVRRCGIKLLRALIARKVVVILLATTVAVELAVLGVGVTRRLDMAYERSLEVSRAQLAVIEARELGQATQGSAAIAAPAGNSADDADAPPPLRVRDVDTILAAGEKIYTADDLCGFIRRLAAGEDVLRAERTAVRSLIHDYQDADSCRRVVDHILRRLEASENREVLR